MGPGSVVEGISKNGMKQQKIGKPSEPSGGLGRGEGGRTPSSLSLPRLSRSLRSPIFFFFFFFFFAPPPPPPTTSEPGPRSLCITHKLTGDIHSSLLLFITCKLHQKQSGKGTLSIVAKRSLKIPEGTA